MENLEKITFKKAAAEYFDWTTFLIVIILVTAGLISVYSATYLYSATQTTGMSPTFTKQVISAIIGLLLLILILFLPERFIQAISYPFYGFSIILLIAVLIFGTETAGTKGWLNLGGFSIQPSEIAKLSTIMAIAKRLSEKGKDIRSLREFGIVLGFVLLPILLILLQPDVGSSFVFIAILFGILLWVGFDLFLMYVVVCIVCIVVLSLINETLMIFAISLFSIIAFFFRKKILFTIISVLIFISIGFISPNIYDHLQPHQKARIQSFINPDSDPLNQGYNVRQSKLAIGSGGLAGKGFLKGTQTQLRYIPKQWTDFIFSVPNEEFGFLGGLAVLLCLFGLIWRSLKTAMEAGTKYFSILSIGITSLLLYHTAVNVGMALGLVPVMGIPLPFMSAGGTFMLVNFAMVGFLLNIYRSKKVKRHL